VRGGTVSGLATEASGLPHCWRKSQPVADEEKRPAGDVLREAIERYLENRRSPISRDKSDHPICGNASSSIHLTAQRYFTGVLRAHGVTISMDGRGRFGR